MIKKAHGFTIVELLIVIVVIAILSGVSIVAYTGMQNRAKNTARYNEVKQWERLFALYKAENGQFPAMSNGNYCLGFGFPSGPVGVNPRCRDYNSTTNGYLESENAALMGALATVGTLPTGDRKPSGGLIVGPWVSYVTGQIHFNFIFDGSSASDCPAGTFSIWNNSLAVYCRWSVANT